MSPKHKVIAKHPDAYATKDETGEWFIFTTRTRGRVIGRGESSQKAWICALKFVGEPPPVKPAPVPVKSFGESSDRDICKMLDERGWYGFRRNRSTGAPTHQQGHLGMNIIQLPGSEGNVIEVLGNDRDGLWYPTGFLFHQAHAGDLIRLLEGVK